MPYSGSELLQVLLHQNPRIYGSVTSPMFEYQFAARANTNLPEVKAQNTELMEKAFDGTCRGIADGYYGAITDRPVVVDKNRGWSAYYNWVARWNPDPKIICMVRDLRSVVASAERKHQKNKHNPEGVENNKELKNLTVGQRVGFFLNSFPIGLALGRVADDHQTGVSKNILYVKYEDLCNLPAETMAGIYEFIGEKPFDHDFDKIVKEVEEDDSHFGIFGRHTVKEKIIPSKSNSWSDVLPPEIANTIKENNKWYFDTFEY